MSLAPIEGWGNAVKNSFFKALNEASLGFIAHRLLYQTCENSFCLPLAQIPRECAIFSPSPSCHSEFVTMSVCGRVCTRA